MTRRDILEVFHEPFGDAFYFGPEGSAPARLQWPAGKIEQSGQTHCTYDHVLQRILEAAKKPDKRVFIKDMAFYLVPPIHSNGIKPQSLQHLFINPGDRNPTLLPSSILQKFQVVFLIRKPLSSIPSLYRCFIPPLSDQTGLHDLEPTEIGYRELRILLDYLYPATAQSPSVSQGMTGSSDSPLVIDADDLLAHPDTVVGSLCAHLSIPYSPSMLRWGSPDDQAHAKSLFEKFAGWHDDALYSSGLNPKTAHNEGSSPISRQEEDSRWQLKYGEKAARMIRDLVDGCQKDYEYLSQFKLRL
ncbi:MAG: hypothetical protein Q9228_004754 [Teloschistes exilis]